MYFVKKVLEIFYGKLVFKASYTTQLSTNQLFWKPDDKKLVVTHKEVKNPVWRSRKGEDSKQKVTKPSAGEGEVANFREFLQKTQNLMITLYIFP